MPGFRVFLTLKGSPARFCQVELTLVRLAAEYEDRTVMAVCHGGVILASVRRLLGVPHPGTGARLQPTNTGVTEWEHDPLQERWLLRSYDESIHLLGLDATEG